ncbi:DUF4251 domain-containing protein [Salinimicrobium sp. TIG7-5_MAKvit]|uniref:DUF4251 domain-containing protein n=1 Tax=Salinimicrobium sp. TIG7-5_MAKvit TaxID=3121289 RepID=UPI003C6DE681
MKRRFLLLFLVLIFVACGSSNRSGEASAEYRQMLEQVQNLDFKIENDWADPAKYSRVNLIGNPNHITFEEDSVEVFLPFFGERQFGGGYGTSGAIEYEGPLNDLEIEEKPGKNKVRIFFRGNNEGENMDFRIIVFANGNTNASVTSSQRDQISYDGQIVKKDPE